MGEVGEGEEALILTQRLEPQVVLVGMDTPRRMGLKTILRPRRMIPEVTIIALSMLGGEACRRAALASGADDFVPKRSLNMDLLPAIQQAMHRSRGGPRKQA